MVSKKFGTCGKKPLTLPRSRDDVAEQLQSADALASPLLKRGRATDDYNDGPVEFTKNNRPTQY